MPKRSSGRSYHVPPKAAKPEVNSVLRRLRGMGLELEFSAGSGHWKVIDPGTGAFLTTVSNTPSDTNWWHQVRRIVEKAGYAWESKGRKKTKKQDEPSLDLAALAHAQQMAKLHGGREPQVGDLEDHEIPEFNEQETEEASMAQGVDEATAHRVSSRLIYLLEQKGNEMAERARERNPRVRQGGALNELMHVSKQVAAERGLRWWKTSDSAWNTLTNIANGTASGMAPWVATILEATMDEIDGLQYAASGPEQPAQPEPPVVSIQEAQDLILSLVSNDWTLRADLQMILVPEQMSTSKFEKGLSVLAQEGLIEREYEKKKQPGMLYRLAAVDEPEPEIVPEPEPEPVFDPFPAPEDEAVLPFIPSEVISGGTIAERYADALLEILLNQNGSADWQQLEPILSRLDKLAGVS